MNPLIISYASKGREDYLKMSETLYDSIKQHWKYDYLLYTQGGNRNCYNGIKLTEINKLPQPSWFDCRPHNEVPYQFKFGLIAYARELGYDKIIWVDSSISLAKCPMELLNKSNNGVMAFHNLGHELQYYISDNCIEKLSSNLNEVKQAKQTWGGCIGFDFNNEVAEQIFNTIVYMSVNGAFSEGVSSRSGFVAHRHDQAVMSVLFHRFGVKLYDYGNIVCFNPHGKEPFEYGKNYTFVYGKNT